MLFKACLINTETHCDAIDTLLDIHMTNSVGSTATVTISYVVDNALALTRLHKVCSTPASYEDLFSPLGDIHEVECYHTGMVVDFSLRPSLNIYPHIPNHECFRHG